MNSSDPSKQDIEILFRRLRSIPSNKVCFDCTAKNPTWASVTYGVFICIDCSAVHRGLGVHLTFVRSTQLDISWTWIQLHKMQLGGNANAEIFFTQHNCTTKDAQTKYNSRAAQLYREKLTAAANQAISFHGNKLNLEPEPPVEHKEKDFDFFDVHTDELSFQDQPSLKESSLSTPTSENSSSCIKDPSFCLSNSGGDETTASKKVTTIGLKKVQAKRSGIGVASRKVGGLGAQKISANFADIEKEAELADKLKVQDKKEEEEQPPLEDEDKITSIRLAYEDLVIQQKKEEDKLKAVDPKKAKQFERLGMGLGARSGVSHSALNDMQTIQQESGETSKAVEGFSFDDFYSSYSPNSSYSMKSSLESRNLMSLLENRESFKTKVPSEFDVKTTISEDDYSTSRKNVPSSSSASSSTDAQKKFGTAKSISSDQYFSDSADSNWERKSNLQRFEGSSSISSADYFGRSEASHRGGIGSQIQTPDLEDVKESVRQGVTKVAGRLSSLANGVFSSIQEKYGGY